MGLYLYEEGMYSMTGFTRNIIPLLFFLFIYNSPIAQPKSFADIDSFVPDVKFEGNVIKLAHDLANPFPQDVSKARAIFKWITNNIAYDYRFVNSGRELTRPDCADKFNCADILRAWENNYIKRILRSRRATADGYAQLFKKLCGINHIQCESIEGYARTKPYQIGNKVSVNHTWNAIYLDTAWYFLDVCWASGYTIENEETGKLMKYVRDFRNYYWITDFRRFSRNHFPKNEYWGEQYQISKEDFFNRPHYYSVDVLDNISNESPATGMLVAKKNDSIYFSFEYKNDIQFIQLNSNNFRSPPVWATVSTSKNKTKIIRDTWAEKKQVYIPFIKTGHNYSFYYPVKDNSVYYLDLVLDYKKAIRYKLTVVK